MNFGVACFYCDSGSAGAFGPAGYCSGYANGSGRGWNSAAGETLRTASARLVAEARAAQRFVVQLATLWRQAAQPAAQLAEVTAFLANLLSLRLPAGYLSMGRLAPEEAHFRTVAALVSLAVALAKRKPTVLVLEDLHWADAHSLRVVERLAASLPTAPLAVVTKWRSP